MYAEMIKLSGVEGIRVLRELFLKAYECGEVPKEWCQAVIVPIYKNKGERAECKNYRGISLLSVAGKVYGRIVVDRVNERTNFLVSDEQGGFRSGRSCV